MKKKEYLLLLLITLVACSKNDNLPQYKTLSLEGEWQVIKYEVKNGIRKSIHNGAVTSESTFSSYAKNINSTYTFTNSPNELTISDSNYTEVITRTGSDGVSDTIEIPSKIEKESFSWKLIADTLKVTNNTKNLESKLTILSEDEIIIVLDENISIGNNSMKTEVSSKKHTTLKKI